MGASCSSIEAPAMVAAKRGYLRPVGAWNFEEVTVKGPHITVELNGTVILDADVSQRLPSPGTGDELDDLGRAFNDLLARREEAF